VGTTGNTEKKHTYTASKGRSEGRSAWAITFRHPLRKDAKGKQGLKVRRGLKTSSEAEADNLVSRMNELLANQEWWSLSRRAEAEKRFGDAVASAFYDVIEEGRIDTRAIRESELPLPGREDGYAKILFVGTTGAGKTTLLRHLIGSHPENDRFPSTSTAKTTVSDIEIIVGGDDYRAVVTFFPENTTRTAIHECLTEACVADLNGASDEEIADVLLNHKDQKFRFSYVLGHWQPNGNGDSDEDWDFGASAASEKADKRDGCRDGQERDVLQAALEGYVRRVKALSARVLEDINSTLEQDIRKLDGVERDAALSEFEDALQADPEFDEIIADILEAVLARFELITETGTLQRRKSGWPEKWLFATPDRDEFISTIKFFSSNAAMSFGRLLTPLVDGIRVRGPLYPVFTTKRTPLVLLDGQGLGHTPDVSGAISTHITEQFNDVDVILLVDNAQTPVQSSSLSVIRFVATGGYERKLAVSFTHFDQVQGINLPRYQDKRNHVLASLKNGITSLRSAAGSAVSSLESRIYGRCFMLGGIDRPSDDLPNGPKQELNRLLETIEASIVPVSRPKIGPVYDTAGLGFAVQTAANDFHRLWNARLGFTWLNGIDQEHWTRVKALARRLALQMDNLEYDNLRPVADLLLRLQEGISKFLDNPPMWRSKPLTREEEIEAINAIRQDVSIGLHDLVRLRLADGQLQNWLAAFDESGPGSASRRALKMRGIYEDAAPIPGIINTESASRFLDDVRELVHSAIEAAGGEVRLARAKRAS
jgi:GTPase Era involved in 16S rRNA processing